MSGLESLFVEQPYEHAVQSVTGRLTVLGFRVLITFDLPVLQNTISGCDCPYHGTENCDCRMSVLLVYGETTMPVSLVAHGHHGRTWFSMVDTSDQPVDPKVRGDIESAIVPVRSQYTGR